MRLSDTLNILEQQSDKTDIVNLTSGINVLDIGCQLGNYWWNLYEKISFKKIIGIDKYSQYDLSEGGQYATISYQSYINAHRQHSKTLNQTEFSETFIFNQTDIETFFTTDLFFKNKYDLIIASNFFYLFEKEIAAKIITKIQTALTDNGYIYIFTLHRKTFNFRKNDLWEHPKKIELNSH